MCSLSTGSRRIPKLLTDQDVFLRFQVFFHRSRDRPRHRQYPDLRARQGNRSRRAVGRPSGRKAANGKKTIQAVGLAAKQMLGRTPGNITAIPPDEGRRDRRLHDPEQMLKYFIKKIHDNQWFRPSPRIVICVPYGSRRSSGARSGKAPSARGFAGIPDRGADGRGDRRRSSHRRCRKLDGGRHRRRHDRSRRDLARRHRVCGLGARGRGPTRRSSTTSAATTAC